MTVSSDAPHFEAKGEVLQFPASSTGARKVKFGVRRYWPIGAAFGLLIVAGSGVLLWFLSGKSSVQYTTAQVTRGTVAHTSTAT